MVLWGDAVLLVFSMAVVFLISAPLGFREGWRWSLPSGWHESDQSHVWGGIGLLTAALLLVYLHFKIRKLAARRVARIIGSDFAPGPERDRLCRAFHFNTRAWHSIFARGPVGWGKITRNRLHRVIGDANEYIQRLNDTFTDPSGKQARRPGGTGSESPALPQDSAAGTPVSGQTQ